MTEKIYIQHGDAKKELRIQHGDEKGFRIQKYS
jgi:hypothetical protein